MDIKINYKKTQELKDLLWNPESTWGTELHRSDPVYCHIKAYCRLVGIKPRIEERTVASWVIGTSLHRIVQDHFPPDRIEVNTPRRGIEVHTDVMWDKPAEIKTTRMSIKHAQDIPREYIDQIRYGTVFHGGSHVYLITLDIVNRTLLVWDVLLDTAEMKDAEDEFDETIAAILYAVQHRDPSILEVVEEECSDCQYNYSPGGCPIYE
jgi:hypothetical protein